jgi:extracellular factor (EF) 3-hydroxypalmitic acid methyl ester biosynthesis protein
VIAHRNRLDYLVETLCREARKRAGRTRVFNLACGPAVEVQRFLRHHEESELCEFDLLDFNGETLDYTREQLTEALRAAGRGTPLHFIQRSVNQILRAAAQGGGNEDFGDYDLVYCAGLFDYLSQRVCKRLVELFCKMVKPGGLVIVTNVAATNPRKACMEYLMEWNLIHRSVAELEDLIPPGFPVTRTEVRADPTGVNLFLEIETANG